VSYIADCVIDVRRVYWKALLDDTCKFVYHLAGIFHLFFLSYQGEMVSAHARPDIEIFLKVFYVFVSRAEQVAGEVRVVKGKLHYLFFRFLFQISLGEPP